MISLPSALATVPPRDVSFDKEAASKHGVVGLGPNDDVFVFRTVRELPNMVITLHSSKLSVLEIIWRKV